MDTEVTLYPRVVVVASEGPEMLLGKNLSGVLSGGQDSSVWTEIPQRKLLSSCLFLGIIEWVLPGYWPVA